MDFYGTLGLESEIVFNDLLLNRRMADVGNGPRYRITDIGGLDDADVRDAREANPMRDGEMTLPAYYGGRTITLTGRIMARNVAEMRTMQTALKRAFSVLEESRLRFYNSSGSTDYIYINVRKSAPIQMREAQANAYPYRDFLVTLRASDPRFYSSATGSFSISSSGLATTFTSINPGQASSDPIIRMTGPLYPTTFGTTAQAAIANLNAGQSLNLSFPSTALMAATAYAEINCATRKVNGSINYSNVLGGSVFPQVISGTNTFYVAGFTGTGNVSVFYKSSWM